MKNTFGELFKTLRIESGQGLREFCLKHHFNPTIISRLERGRDKVPDSKLLETYAVCLGLEKDSRQWNNFFEVAHNNTSYTPEPMTDEELVSHLPVPAFIGLSGQYTEAQINELVNKIRNA